MGRREDAVAVARTRGEAFPQSYDAQAFLLQLLQLDGSDAGALLNAAKEAGARQDRDAFAKLLVAQANALADDLPAAEDAARAAALAATKLEDFDNADSFDEQSLAVALATMLDRLKLFDEADALLARAAEAGAKDAAEVFALRRYDRLPIEQAIAATRDRTNASTPELRRRRRGECEFG
ncbi:MAG: hypothetical protein AAGK78_06410, partial [Planctomycetota bacterium]